MATLIQVLTTLVILGVSSGIEVGPVRLVSNGRYIDYRSGPSKNNSVLECPVVLEADEKEVLKMISWKMLGPRGNEVVGSYDWTPPNTGIASGVLNRVVNLGRSDGSLELTELRYNLSGYYECSATLTNGRTQKAEKWEALIIDSTASRVSSRNEDKPERCAVVSNTEISAIYPSPTVHSGLYSLSRHGYITEVTDAEWSRVVNPNKSVSYSHHETEFEINEHTPEDAYFLLTIGVTKTDGNYISLYQVKGTSRLVEERGCPALTHKAYQLETYTPDKRNCRGEYDDSFGELKVTVQCQDGYRPGVEVSTVNLTCDLENYEWRNEKVEDPSYDLHCVLAGTHPEGFATLVLAAIFLLRLV